MSQLQEHEEPALRVAAVDHLRSAVSRRRAGLPAWVLLTELFIGLGWLRAVAEKVISAAWWRGEVITTFLAEHEAQTVGWYRPIIDVIVAPYPRLIAVVVVAFQLHAGIGLVSGYARARGLAIGLFLNVNFLAAGAVNPSAFYLLSQGALALWLAEQVRRRFSLQALTAVALAGAAIAIVSLPYVTTFEPHEVIEDPAVMLVTGGLLTVVGCDLAHRNLTGGQGLRWGRPDADHKRARRPTDRSSDIDAG